MEILCLQPEERLRRTELNQVKDSKAERRTFFIYTCPGCGQKASFTLADLMRNSHSSPPSESGSLLYRALFDWESRSKKGSESPEKTVTPENLEEPENLQQPQNLQKPEKPEKLNKLKTQGKMGQIDEINGVDKATGTGEIFCHDFQCSGCNQPVRIEYTAHLNSVNSNPAKSNSIKSNSVNGHSASSNPVNGCSSLKIVRVLEIVLPPFPSKEELLAKLNRVTDIFYSLSSGQPPSAFPYLWLVALILFPILSGYDSPQDMAGYFSQEREKIDAIIGWSFVWEWIDEGHEHLMRDQLSLWLAMILRFGDAVEEALTRMLKIAHLLQQQGMEKGPQTLSLALALALENNRSNEEILACVDRMIRLRKGIPTQEKSGLFWESLLVLVLTDDAQPDHLRQIEQALGEKKFSPDARRLQVRLFASLFAGDMPQGMRGSVHESR